MKNAARKIGRGSVVVPALMGFLLTGASLLPVVAKAAIYVDGKKCAGDAWELPNGNFKCRTADGSVAEGAGKSAVKGPAVKGQKKEPSPHKALKPVQPETTK